MMQRQDQTHDPHPETNVLRISCAEFHYAGKRNNKDGLNGTPVLNLKVWINFLYISGMVLTIT